MKTRNGLISNSSTTSFIIAFNKNKSCDCCHRTDPDFHDIILCMNNYDNRNYQIFSYGNPASAIVAWMEKDEAFDEEDKNIVREKLEKLSDKQTVMYFEISHHTGWLLDIIDNILESGSGQLIWKTEE